MVRGSEYVASSFQSWSFARLGRPAKRSRTEPTMVFLCSLRSTSGAVLMLVFSMLSSPLSVTDDILANGTPVFGIWLRAVD